jgi:hypothetical protein
MSSFKVQRAEETTTPSEFERSFSKEVVDEMSDVDKQGYALAFRRAGMSYRQIADVFHYETEVPVRALLKKAIETGKSEDQSILRELELARLDRLTQAIWPAAVSGDLKAVETSIKLMDMRAKLMGLRLPVELSGPGGGPIPIEIQNAKEQLDTRFSVIAERRRERARAKSTLGH